MANFLISGFPVGIVANQVSIINPNEAAKGAQFIRLCNQQLVIFLLHTTRDNPARGKKEERKKATLANKN